MRGFAVAASLTLLLGAAPVFAQGGPPKPAAPAQPPAQIAPAPQPPAPFPQGAKVALVNLQQIFATSAEGKVMAARVNGLIQKKQVEGAEKTKLLAANQQKLQTSAGVMSESARLQLQKEVEKLTVDGQRFEQDAQSEVNELQQSLQEDFQIKLLPVLQELSAEKGLQILFSAADAGIIWIADGLDLTMEAVNKLDAATAKPAAPAPKQ